MQKIISTILVLLSAAVFICGQTSENPSQKIADKPATANKPATDFPELIGLTGEKAPVFTSTNMEGTPYNLENLRGKIVVINLWATFCSPCIGEMPELNTLVEKYAGKDVVFLAPTPDEKSGLEGFLQKHSFKYQVLPNSYGIIQQYAPKEKESSPTDSSDSFKMILPAHLIIDRDGMVVKHFWGYKKETVANELQQGIEQLLTKKVQ